jgi:capsular exopolysaccharide synthesis family protein
MGRIAAAMKRAQRQREARGAQTAPTSEVTVGPPADRTEGSFDNLQEAPSLGTEWIATSPALEPVEATRASIGSEQVDRHVIACHEPGSATAEKYRSVRTRLLTARKGRRTSIHAIVSTQGGEGRSVTAANLGFCMAEFGHLRVAVVDLDFRRRGLTEMFRLADAPGMAEVIREEADLDDICVPAVRTNLYVVPAGELGDSAISTLLGNERLSRLFAQLHDRFHYIFVDTPPMHDVSDAGLIAPLCHSVLLVVRMNCTPESYVRRSIRTIQVNGIPIEGCILTGERDMHIPILCGENNDNAFGSGF